MISRPSIFSKVSRGLPELPAGEEARTARPNSAAAARLGMIGGRRLVLSRRCRRRSRREVRGNRQAARHIPRRWRSSRTPRRRAKARVAVHEADDVAAVAHHQRNSLELTDGDADAAGKTGNRARHQQSPPVEGHKTICPIAEVHLYRSTSGKMTGRSGERPARSDWRLSISARREFLLFIGPFGLLLTARLDAIFRKLLKLRG